MNDDLSKHDLDLHESRSGAPSSRLGADGVTYPVGFFHFSFNPSNGSGLGGLLITDNTGIPLEFIVTTAVRTTHAQRILYGKRLRSFIAVNLCAKQLLQDVKTTPKVVFVREEWLLNIHRLTTIPVLQLVPTEQLGDLAGRPSVVPPENHPEYTEVLDLTSLDTDMVDAFERIETCREVLAAKAEDYRL
jgi:hypothetical protein